MGMLNLAKKVISVCMLLLAFSFVVCTTTF